MQNDVFKASYQISHKSTPEFEERLANLRRGNRGEHHSLFSQEEIKQSLRSSTYHCVEKFIGPFSFLVQEVRPEGLSEDVLEKRLMALKTDPALEDLERRLEALNSETSFEQLQRRFEALKRPSMEQLQERLVALKRIEKIPAHERPPTKQNLECMIIECPEEEVKEEEWMSFLSHSVKAHFR